MTEDWTIRERMERYTENQERRGMKQVKLWIPENRVNEFKQMANEARQQQLESLKVKK